MIMTVDIILFITLIIIIVGIVLWDMHKNKDEQ